MSDIIIGTFGNNILVTTCVFISGFMIFTICEAANSVVLKVSSQIIYHHVRCLGCLCGWRLTLCPSGLCHSVVR
jgi:hypothetical protein